MENVTYSGVGGIFCPDYFLFSGFCGHKRCEIFSSPGSVYTCFDGGKRGNIGFLDRFDFAFRTGVFLLSVLWVFFRMELSGFPNDGIKRKNTVIDQPGMWCVGLLWAGLESLFCLDLLLS